MKHTSKVVKISLSLALMVFVLTMTPVSSLFNIVKPVSAAPLTSMSVSPTSNIINELATYSFQFKTATSGTIKTIEISFPSSFDVSGIRLVEREGISSGTLSSTGSTIKYTLGSAQSISDGTNIRLEIARIIATAEGSFTVSIKTLNSQGGTIDGPTTSGPFIIKSIDGNDVSPAFMIRKTLKDDPAGNALGWNPNGVDTIFSIDDPDVTGSPDGTFVQAYDQSGGRCRVTNALDGPELPGFLVRCEIPASENGVLQYMITKLPANVVTSSASVSSPQSSSSSTSIPSSPFDSLLIDK